MIYLLYGQERLLLDNKVKELQKKYQCTNEQMNLSTYHGDTTTMEEVYLDLTTPPFLSEYKMVVLYQPAFLTTKKQKKENNDDTILLDYLSKDSDDVIFILFCYGNDLDKRKKVVKEVLKKGNVIQLDKLSHYKVKEIVRKSIMKRNCEIDEDALEELLARTQEDLLRCSNEVEKLCIYTSTITMEDVETLVARVIEDDVIQLTRAILRRDHQSIFRVYKDLLVSNTEPVRIIALLAAQMRILYQVKLLDRKGYNDKEIASMLKVNPYRLKYVREDGDSYELQDLLQCLDQLAKLDEGIKTGKIDRFKGFELFILRL